MDAFVLVQSLQIKFITVMYRVFSLQQLSFCIVTLDPAILGPTVTCVRLIAYCLVICSL